MNPSENPVDQRRAQRRVIFTQCVGVLPMLVYQNGLLLAYLTRLGLRGEQILFLLGLPNIINALSTIPLAHLGDRVGVRLLGGIGIACILSAFSLILFASFVSTEVLLPVLVLAIGLHGLGQGLFGSGWFALLRPLVDPDERGRFFARLRMSWQTVGIAVGCVFAYLLTDEPGLLVYRVIFAAILAALVLRWLIYRGIPDRTTRREAGESLLSVLRWLVSLPDYLALGSYLFLLSACTGACPWLFGLVQKQTLDFSDSQVVSMGIMLAIGSMAGFWLGGRLVDRYGCRSVFLVAHLAYALLLALVLLRGFSPWSLSVTFGAISLAWGLVGAASGIAITSEVMGLAPERNQALAIATLTTLQQAGVALAAFLGSRLVSMGLFAQQWTLFGTELGNYDAVLVLLAIAVVAITVTLGLVPSVIRKAAYYPQFPGQN